MVKSEYDKGYEAATSDWSKALSAMLPGFVDTIDSAVDVDIHMQWLIESVEILSAEVEHLTAPGKLTSAAEAIYDTLES